MQHIANGGYTPVTNTISKDDLQAGLKILEAEGFKLNESQEYNAVMSKMALNQYIAESNGYGGIQRKKSFFNVNESVTPGNMFSYQATMGQQGIPAFPTSPDTSKPATPYSNSNTGSGDRFPSLLPVAIQAARQTIFFDILGANSVINMTSNNGILYYMRPVYGGGRVDSTIPPLVIETSSLNGKTALSDGPATTAMATIGSAPLGTYVLLTTTANAYTGTGTVDATAATATFKLIGYSPISGNAILQVVSKQDASNLQALFVATATLVFVAKGTTLTSTTAAASIGGYLALTSSNNGIKSVSATEVVTYGVSAISDTDTTSDYFAGYTPNGSGVEAYNANNGMTRNQAENNLPKESEIEISSKQFEARVWQHVAKLGIIQAQDTKQMFGIDGIDVLKDVQANAIAQDMNIDGLYKINTLATDNSTKINLVEGTNLLDANRLLLNGTVGATTNFENTQSYQKRFVSILQAGKNLIRRRNRVALPNKLLTSSFIASGIVDSAETGTPNVTKASNDNAIKVGSVAGMEIYENLNAKIGDNSLTLIYATKNEKEAGLKFCPYIMATFVETTPETSMGWKGLLQSRAAFVETGFFPETNYMKIVLNSSDVEKLTGAVGL